MIFPSISISRSTSAALEICPKVDSLILPSVARTIVDFMLYSVSVDL